MSSEQREKKEANAQGKPLGTLGRGFRLVGGTTAWKRQAAIVGHRLSFPMFRHIWKRERERSQQTVFLRTVAERDLKRSKIAHGALAITMGICLGWALLNILKGTVAMVRFDVYYNVWLISGVPLALFSGVQLCTSLLTYRLMSEELICRGNPAEDE